MSDLQDQLVCQDPKILSPFMCEQIYAHPNLFVLLTGLVFGIIGLIFHNASHTPKSQNSMPGDSGSHSSTGFDGFDDGGGFD
ncbi:hypothetical protein [Celeribacter baekdonensis]|uniref:hypothetical protein n=1 Tax=Celeribacter baekdonensis TaxID=875171 RepID=UPI00115F7A74|nr:hypothetical protein [Celeribacter baekdonensis]